MKTCKGCKYAEWQKTTNGRLHPSGDGKCLYKIKNPQLPNSLYWISHPSIGGGTINRREEYSEHCPYWSEE